MKELSMDIPRIVSPIKVILTSNNYMLKIKDADGIYHYFDNNGNYDGYSYELIPHIEDNPN